MIVSVAVNYIISPSWKAESVKTAVFFGINGLIEKDCVNKHTYTHGLNTNFSVSIKKKQLVNT